MDPCSQASPTRITDMSESISVNTYSETSISTVVETSLGDETSTVAVNATGIVGTQMPDDSESISAGASATADAFGEDTLTVASVSGEASDDGLVASVDLDVDALAVGASSTGDDAFAVAITDAALSDGAEMFFVATVESELTESNAEESVSVAYSETHMTAVDIDLSGGGAGDAGDGDPAAINDVPTIEPDVIEVPSTVPEDPALSEPSPDAGLADLVDIDGNVAIVEVDVTVNAEDSAVVVDAFALAIEDELSTSIIDVDLALSV